VLYIGSKGKLLQDTYGANPRLLPQSLHDSAGTPKQTLPRIATSHEMNWVRGGEGQDARRRPRSSTPRGSPRSCCSASCRCAPETKDPLRRRSMRVTNSKGERTSSGASTAPAGTLSE
jgi:hypothetical protein